VNDRYKDIDRIHSINADAVETVKQLIRLFPGYRQYYNLTDNPFKTYITSVIHVEDMCRLYCKNCEEGKILLVNVSCIDVFSTNILILLPYCLDLIPADTLMNRTK
jgi:hypothetical protein